MYYIVSIIKRMALSHRAVYRLRQRGGGELQGDMQLLKNKAINGALKL